tara:strand:- start:48557 stop:49891 length:1335 start_codon:yes stop_codon:yes gene_type:complete
MKIIYLLLDAISYQHSWLSNNSYMPNLKKHSEKGMNFHNHYAVTHNTRGNLAAMFYGASSSITQVMGRKQSLRESGLESLQKKLKNIGYETSYIGTQPLFHSEKKGDNLDFSRCIYLSPSMSDFYIPAENFNKYIFQNKKKIQDKSLSFFHFTDCHEPYETPDNQLDKKTFPNIHNFHYRLSNIFYRIPRKVYKNFFSYNNAKKKKEIFSLYPRLKELCIHPFGSVNTPERYSWFYEKVWSDRNFLYEYEKMMTVTLKYLDKHINETLKFIKEYHKHNTLIFISSDHGNNGVLSPAFKLKYGLLSDAATHIPLSLLTFDEKIKEKFFYERNIHKFTSHTNFFKTILNLIDNKKNKFEKESLISKDIENEYVLSELNDERFDYGECVIRNLNERISLRIKSSDNPQTLKLIEFNDILNSINQNDYNKYYNFKSKYNLNFDKSYGF